MLHNLNMKTVILSVLYFSKLIWKMKCHLWNISIFCSHIAKPWVWFVTFYHEVTTMGYHTEPVEDSVLSVPALKRKISCEFTWAKKCCKIKKYNSLYNSQLAELYYCYTEPKTVVHVLYISLLVLLQNWLTIEKIV